MTQEKINQTQRDAYESISTRLDDELINAIDCIITHAVYHSIELDELLNNKFNDDFAKDIEIALFNRGTTCKTGFDCWNALRLMEVPYITATYNFVEYYK